MSAKQVLNVSDEDEMCMTMVQPAEELSIALQRHILSMKGKYLSEDGRGVDYVKLRESETFKSYIETAKDLKLVDLYYCTEEQRKAFFISILSHNDSIHYYQ